MNLKDIRHIRKGMSWGSQEHGIAQLTETELFLLSVIDDIEEVMAHDSSYHYTGIKEVLSESGSRTVYDESSRYRHKSVMANLEFEDEVIATKMIEGEKKTSYFEMYISLVSEVNASIEEYKKLGIPVIPKFFTWIGNRTHGNWKPLKF